MESRLARRAQPAVRWTVALALLLFVGAALAVAGCEGRESEDEEEALPGDRVDELGRVILTAAERAALDLRTEAVQDGTLEVIRLRFGIVIPRPEDDAVVIAPVVGRLAAPLSMLGAKVDEGDEIARIEPLVDTTSRATLAAERRELQGRIESAEAEAQAKEAEIERLSTLVATGLATAAEQAAAEAALRSERALVESLSRAGDELGRATGEMLSLRAPTSGVIATLTTGTGLLVEQGTVIARIVRRGPRWIELAVPPEDSIGDSYRVQLAQSDVRARLLHRGAMVQSDGTRRDRLEVDPDAAPDVLPGATVPVEVLQDVSGVLVSTEAIVRRNEEKLVFIAIEAGTYEPRVVDVAARELGRAAVISGLSAGDQVVVRGASSLLGELESGGAPRVRNER